MRTSKKNMENILTKKIFPKNFDEKAYRRMFSVYTPDVPLYPPKTLATLGEIAVTNNATGINETFKGTKFKLEGIEMPKRK